MNNKEFEKLLNDLSLLSSNALNVNASNLDVQSASSYRNTSLTKTLTTVNTSGTKILGWNIVNRNTYAVYVKIYTQSATSGTITATEPSMIITVPAGTADAPGLVYQEPNCVQHTIDGIKIRATKGIDIADNVDAANPIYIEMKYKT